MKDFFTKDRLRAIISYSLAFLVCLGVFAIAVSSALFVISSPKVVLSIAEKSNYGELAADGLTEELNYLAIPSGLPEDFFTGAVDTAEFKALFLTVAEKTITADKEYKLDLSDFNAKILNMVTDYSKNESGDFTEEVQKDIVLFANECENIYLSYVNPSLISYLLTLLVSARKYACLALLIAASFSFICGFVLFKLNHISSFVKHLFFAFSGASLTIGVIPAILLASNEISRVAISSKSLYAFVTVFAQQALWVALISAMVLALIAIILVSFKIFTLIFRK